MTKILNFASKIKEGGREGGTREVLRPCHPPKKIWNVNLVTINILGISEFFLLGLYLKSFIYLHANFQKEL